MSSRNFSGNAEVVRRKDNRGLLCLCLKSAPGGNVCSRSRDHTHSHLCHQVYQVSGVRYEVVT